MKSKIEAATTWMEDLAADNSHGYSQASRWGPDYDCSSAVIQAWEQAGVPVKTMGASFTGNMRSVFLRCGFKDVTTGVNLGNGSGLKRGDVLINEAEHAAMATGMGRVVHARSSEGNTQPGDQSGNEIRVQGYWDYPWDCVLRYPEAVDDDSGEAEDDAAGSGGLEADGICGPQTWAAIADEIRQLPTLQCVRDTSGRVISMPEGWHVTLLQAFLNYKGADLDADSEYGPLTESAVKKYQRTFSGGGSDG